MSDSHSPPSPPRTRPWVRIVLFVSLALNLLVLGLVAGAFLGFRKDGADREPRAALVRDLGLGPYLQALSQEDRTEIRKSAHAQRPRLKGGRAQMQATFRETITVLRAEALDAERLRRLIQRQAEVADQGRQLGQDLLVARISVMSVAQRQALADRLEASMRRHRKPPKPNR